LKTSSIIKIISIVLIVAAIALLIAMLSGAFSNKKEISYSSFLENLEKGNIKAVYFDGNYSMSILYNETNISDDNFPKKADAVCNISSRTLVSEEIREICETEDIALPTITYDDPSEGSLWSSILPMGIALIIGGIFIWIIFRQNAGANSKAMSFGNTKAQMVKNIKVRFNDVAGAEEEKEELKEIVEFLKSPKKFLDVGARIPRGVLLVGPPGTGKTLFAKAVAGEANVPFFSISGSDFVEMFVGVGASRVRDLFAQAKRNMPCIVFIDEIDAVGRQRGAGLGGGNDEREQTLNQLLVQMDGFETGDGIIVMAATNRADILDPALMRPGRFDRQIYVNIPDVKGREAILKVHARNKPLAGDIDFKTIARITTGFTGADLSNLLNEAAILAARNNRKIVLMEDILEGINKVIMGPQKKSRVVTAADKRITAYHESGHAIIAKVLENCDDVQEVSIIPRGMAAGYTLTRPKNEDSHYTKNQLSDTICMMLGGRAAEEIVIKDITTGASNDIQRASDTARRMVTEWGMSELGCIYLGGDQEVFVGKSWGTHSSVSEDMTCKVDSEVKKIIDGNYKRALDILNGNREIMEGMVKLLFEKETIYKEDVDKLFAGVSPEQILIEMNAREKHPNINQSASLTGETGKTGNGNDNINEVK